jgi:hypothetical protein
MDYVDTLPRSLLYENLFSRGLISEASLRISVP